MKEFSTSWKGSKKARKQRKYRANLPLHLRHRLVRVHLSKELRKKLKTRNVIVRTGDKIKVIRGQFKKKDGKVERVDRKNEMIYVNGIEIIKKDGTKVLLGVHPSNLMITELNMDDKIRKQRLETIAKNDVKKEASVKS